MFWFTAPKFPPANVTAELNATNSILVKWSNLAQGGIRGYRVVYTGVNNPFATENSISVDYFDQEIILKDLFYYTQYMIRVSAFTAFEGNLSQPVYVTTGESGNLSALFVIYTRLLSANSKGFAVMRFCGSSHLYLRFCALTNFVVTVFSKF